mgnify:FL=1|tara:strand:- start:129 stop:458 length:330 start_codon:yes stop_codon:yes gene_type:complete
MNITLEKLKNIIKEEIDIREAAMGSWGTTAGSGLDSHAFVKPKTQGNSTGNSPAADINQISIDIRKLLQPLYENDGWGDDALNEAADAAAEALISHDATGKMDSNYRTH